MAKAIGTCFGYRLVNNQHQRLCIFVLPTIILDQVVLEADEYGMSKQPCSKWFPW